MGGVDASSVVGLKEVLVAGSCGGHAEFIVGILAEIRGWCATEPVGFVTAPAISEGWYMAFGLQVDTEKRITIGVERRIAVGITGSVFAGTRCRLICGFSFSLHDGIFSEFLRGREPQKRRFHLSLSKQLRQI